VAIKLLLILRYKDGKTIRRENLKGPLSSSRVRTFNHNVGEIAFPPSIEKVCAKSRGLKRNYLIDSDWFA